MADTPQSLLQRIAADANDESGWQTFYDLYSPFLKGILGARLGGAIHDIDDIVQETLVVVVRKIPEFHHNNNAGAFRRWLREIVVRKLAEFHRKLPPDAAGVGDVSALLAELEDENSKLTASFDFEHQNRILENLCKLARSRFKPDQWELFERVVLKRESPAAVAESAKVSVNTVYLTKSRVLKWLRDEGRGLLDFEE